MTEQQIGLLVVQFFVSTGVLVFLGIHLLRAREERYKYRLFAVRDKLLYLVGAGQLSETSMVFKVFYKAMNTFVGELNALTLVSFVRASVAVRTELEKENQQRLVEAFQRATPEVQSVIHEFVRIVMDALRYNSPMLNLVIVFSRHCVRLFRFARRHKNFEAPIYETYRYYEDIPGRFGLA